MRPHGVSHWALGTAVLLIAAASVANAQSEVEPAIVSRHPRGILDDIANLLNPSRLARAGESETDTVPTDGADTTTPLPSSSTGSARTTPSSSQPASSTKAQPTSATETDTPASTTQSRTPTSSTTRQSSTHTSATSTRATSSAVTTTSDTQASTSSVSSSVVIVTVTRPGVTTTALVPPQPTIDQANGDKADVGASSNMTTVIVAPCVTAVALLMCAILYYLYAKRKNRVKYGDEDVFAKGAHHSSGAPFAQQETHTSPFIPAQHASSGDGYIKEEGPRPAYGTYAPPNPRYQPQQTVPLVQSNSRYVPPPLPPTHGATYATNERDSQFTETYAYEPPQHASARQPPFNPNHHGGGRRA